jgi:serine/threonine protein kinase
MAMTYTDALLALSNVDNKELQNTDDMYGKVLIAAVAPHDCSFERYIGIGLDGVVILAQDVKDMRKVIFKFAKPRRSEQPRIDAVMQKAKAVFKRRLTVCENNDTQRFLRGAILQQKIATFAKDNAEACAIGRVPEVFAVGKSPQLFLKMEYCEGTDLMSWLKTETNVQTRIKIIRDICQFIKITMHDKNIIHSDLKPDNFIISGAGENYRVILIDFVGAKDMSDSMQVTFEAETRYSLPYSSQNQLTNYAMRTFSDDVHSCGVIFYNAVTQKSSEDLVLENPCALTFAKMHPLNNLKRYDEQAVFNRATGGGFKYHRFDDMIADIDEKLLKTKEILVEKKEKNVDIIEIWREYLCKKKSFIKGEQCEKLFFDIIDD